MKFYLQKYMQNNQDFLIGTMTAGQIIKNSKVLVYNRDEGGYQREPNQQHINKISNYINGQPNFILPTAIILGVDNDLVNYKKVAENLYEVNIDEGVSFRIVDGQHRIAGLKKSLSTNPNISQFSLPVVIIVTNPQRRSVELEIFSDINSKSKRINTDLARLAKYDYELIENNLKKEEVTNHIAIKTAFNLKENNESVWSNAIKFDIQTDFNYGIIGVSMFAESISKIVDEFKLKHNFNYDLTSGESISQCNLIADDIALFLDDIWTNRIAKKWGATFKENYQINSEGEPVKTFYDSKYYIQKGIGTKSINGFIADNIDIHSSDNGKQKINDLINSSTIKSEDWIVGGRFAGYNSESGFKKIKELLNEKEKTLK